MEIRDNRAQCLFSLELTETENKTNSSGYSPAPMRPQQSKEIAPCAEKRLGS
jgi:hypothetical protein